MENRKSDLEDRLVRFACPCISMFVIFYLIPKQAKTLEYQLSKSSTSSALVYGDVQAAESKADFIHKVKVVLKK